MTLNTIKLHSFFLLGSFLGTETIEIVMEESVFDCVHRCVNTPNCKSINYRRKGSGNNCYLNKKNRREESEEAMITDDNFIHYDVDYHTQRSEEPEFGTTNIHMVRMFDSRIWWTPK